MSEPIVFISHFRVKEGKLDALKQFARATSEQIKADKPGNYNHMPQPMGGYIRFTAG